VSLDEAAVAVRAVHPYRTQLSRLTDFGIVLSCVVLFAVLSIASGHFLTRTNLLNILDQWSSVGIIACAGTLVLIAGGFDLSVGANFAISGVIAAKVANASSVELGFLAAIISGLGIGITNGILATVGRINPIIGTLATGMIVRGAAVIVTGGFIITVTDPSFSVLGGNEFLSAKISVYIFVAFAVLTSLILSRTVLGRYIYAVGGNTEAARRAGIPVRGVRATTYAVSGLAASLAGVISVSRVSSGQADVGVGLELLVVAAIVVGGTSILGGEGAIWRTVLGVLLLAMIGNGLNLLAVDPIYTNFVQGGIILTAIAVDSWSRVYRTAAASRTVRRQSRSKRGGITALAKRDTT
jgi:ribose transport system permease protein